MIHFGKCIKYQYRDTILNQVSVSVSRYNLEVSYPTLQIRDLNEVCGKKIHKSLVDYHKSKPAVTNESRVH